MSDGPRADMEEERRAEWERVKALAAQLRREVLRVNGMGVEHDEAPMPERKGLDLQVEIDLLREKAEQAKREIVRLRARLDEAKRANDIAHGRIEILKAEGVTLRGQVEQRNTLLAAARTDVAHRHALGNDRTKLLHDIDDALYLTPERERYDTPEMEAYNEGAGLSASPLEPTSCPCPDCAALRGEKGETT